MKIEDAEKKLCPMSLNGKGARCHTTDCMAWEPETKIEEKTIKIDEPIIGEWFVANKWVDSLLIRRYVEIPEGDCGMKPSAAQIMVEQI